MHQLCYWLIFLADCWLFTGHWYFFEQWPNTFVKMWGGTWKKSKFIRCENKWKNKIFNFSNEILKHTQQKMQQKTIIPTTLKINKKLTLKPNRLPENINLLFCLFLLKVFLTSKDKFFSLIECWIVEWKKQTIVLSNCQVIIFTIFLPLNYI